MKDIKQHNDKGQAHGYWELYQPHNGSIWFKGFYNNGKRVGNSECYFNNDNELSYKIYYI